MAANPLVDRQSLFRTRLVLASACALFSASGFVQETVLTDYVLDRKERDVQDVAGRFVIPVTIDDLAANGLLGEDYPQTCWERSVETLTARKNDITGVAVASDEQIEAYLLYMKDGEMMSLRSFVDDGGSRLRLLLSRVGVATLRFPKVHPEEISRELLDALGFRPASEHRVYAAGARSA